MVSLSGNGSSYATARQVGGIRKLPLLLTRPFVDSLRRLRLNRWLVEGNERSSGARIRMVYLGHQSGFQFVRQMVYGGDVEQCHCGKVWAWNAARIMRSAGPDTLCVAEATERSSRALITNQSFYVPMWIEGQLDIDTAIDRSRRIGNVKEDLRRIRKNRLYHEVTCDEHAIEDFHRNMYVPYIKNVYGAAALYHSLESLRLLQGRVELLLIKRDDEVLAGQILVYEDGRVRTREIGVRNGDRRYLKAGVMGAIYYYGILHLKEKGFSTAGLGGSRAWLNDGVLRFKKKWGMRLGRYWPSGFVLAPGTVTAGVAAFLMQNPLIALRNGGLEGVIFVTGNEPWSAADVRRLYRDYFYEGMRQLSIYPLADGLKQFDIPEELARQLRRRETFLGCSRP